MTMAHKTIQVSNSNKKSPAHCMVHSPSKVKSVSYPFVTLLPTSTPPSHFSSDYHQTVVCVCVSYIHIFCLIPSPFFAPPPKPPPF